MSNRIVSLARVLLQKHFWLLQLLFLTTITLLGALGVSYLAEAYLADQTRIVGVGDEVGAGIVVAVERNRMCFQIDEETGCLFAGDPTPL